jgi:hypothetical protein
MADTFEESLAEAQQMSDTTTVRAGDTCPEDCERSLREINHPRDSKLDVDPHPSYSRVEVVCVHHGIVRTLR